MDVISAAPDYARNLSREKREAILDGAALVFAARGYEGASMSMITAAAGVSRGTIYQHFTGKAALFGAAVARECERSLAPLFQTAAASTDSCRAIERVVHAEAERFPELALAFFEAGPAPAIAMMSRLLSAHAAAGDLVVEDPDFAAEQFFTLCQTRVVARRRLGLPVAPGDEARAVEGAVVVFLSAYGKAG